MSSEEGTLRAARRNPEWWFQCYAAEYLSDGAEIAEAREDFDAMIQQIERRVLAQQPCYHDECQGHAEPGCYIGLNCPCGPCTARAAQTQETSG